MPATPFPGASPPPADAPRPRRPASRTTQRPIRVAATQFLLNDRPVFLA